MFPRGQSTTQRNRWSVVVSKELRDLAQQLRDAIARGDLPEVARLLDLLNGKPDDTDKLGDQLVTTPATAGRAE